MTLRKVIKSDQEQLCTFLDRKKRQELLNLVIERAANGVLEVERKSMGSWILYPDWRSMRRFSVPVCYYRQVTKASFHILSVQKLEDVAISDA